MRTIETEKAGLVALAAALEGDLHDAFCDAVRRLGDITGRVIVTGIGHWSGEGAALVEKI